MKITNLRLKRLIKESIKTILNEGFAEEAEAKAKELVNLSNTSYKSAVKSKFGADTPDFSSAHRGAGEVASVSQVTLKNGLILRAIIVTEPKTAAKITVGLFAPTTPTEIKVADELKNIKIFKTKEAQETGEEIKANLLNALDEVAAEAKNSKIPLQEDRRFFKRYYR